MPKTMEELKAQGAIEVRSGGRPPYPSYERVHKARLSYWEWQRKRDNARAFNRDQYLASEISSV